MGHFGLRYWHLLGLLLRFGTHGKPLTSRKMRGFKIASIRLAFYEDEENSHSASVTIDWVHDQASASTILKMVNGPDLPPLSFWGHNSSETKALKTVRTFRFENRDDALEAYIMFEHAFRKQKQELSPPDGS